MHSVTNVSNEEITVVYMKDAIEKTPNGLNVLFVRRHLNINMILIYIYNENMMPSCRIIRIGNKRIFVLGANINVIKANKYLATH